MPRPIQRRIIILREGLRRLSTRDITRTRRRQRRERVIYRYRTRVKEPRFDSRRRLSMMQYLPDVLIRRATAHRDSTPRDVTVMELGVNASRKELAGSDIYSSVHSKRMPASAYCVLTWPDGKPGLGLPWLQPVGCICCRHTRSRGAANMERFHVRWYSVTFALTSSIV